MIMSASSANRKMVLSLYKQLLREGSNFPTYNFRMYTLRRTRDAFKENKNLADETAIKKCIDEAIVNLEVIKRQVVIGNLYKADKLIIENEK